ncbi:MAG: hypothetical protein AAFX08_09320 [Pseudomonadota bacterium]
MSSALFATASVAEDRIWVINNGDGDVSVVASSPPRTVTRLKFDAQPIDLAVSKTDHLAFVALEGANGPLIAYDAVSAQAVWRAEAGVALQEIDLAAGPDGGVALAAIGERSIILFDIATGRRIAQSQLPGKAKMIAANGPRRRAAIAGVGGSRRIGVFDLSTIDGARETASPSGGMSFGGGLTRQAAAPRRGLVIGQIDGLNGFEVGDVLEPSDVRRVKHDKSLGLPSLIKALGFLNTDGFSRCHGVAVNKDESEVWATCGKNLNVHTLETPGYPPAAYMRLPSRGLWVTFSSDGARAYVSMPDENAILIVDAASKQFIETILVGEDPVRAVAVTVEKPSTDPLAPSDESRESKDAQ